MPSVVGCVWCSSGEVPAEVANGRLGENKIKYKRMSSIKLRDIKRRRKRQMYSSEVYEMISQKRASPDAYAISTARAMEGSMRSYHERHVTEKLLKGRSEDEIPDCMCCCRDRISKRFHTRRSVIYAALWSLQQGCPGEAWGDVFVGGLGQMLWTFPFLK